MSVPTISSAVLDTTRGNYYEFHKEVVIHRFIVDGNIVLNYWLHDELKSCEMCDNTDWEPSNCDRFCSGYCAKEYYDNIIPCRVCGSDCRDCDYEKWQFCTRSCMVRY